MPLPGRRFTAILEPPMTDVLLDRLPPQNLDAEMSVLGAALIDREATIKAVETLTSDCFYLQAHQTIFKTIVQLQEQGDPVDLITVANLLRKRELLDSIGGAAYLAELANAVHTTANAEYHAGIVDEKSVLRRLIRAGNEIIALAYDPKMEIAGILDEAEKKIFEVSNRQIGGALHHIKPLLSEAFEKLEARFEQEDAIQDGHKTGLVDLDDLLTGLQPSDMIVLAARPSMGKTAFCLNIATHVAVHGRKPVVVFSLEMSKEQIAQRILCGEAQINAFKLKHGQLHEHEWSRLTSAIGRLSEAPIYIDDTSGITPMEMKAKCRRLKAEHKEIGLIVVDYLQLMEGGSGGGDANRVQEISKISRAMKSLAREMSCPVMALSQLSRAVEQRTNKRPQLSDLRESGAIEQDADIVMFIYRDEYYNPDSDQKNTAEVIVAKHRNGPVGTVKLFFNKDITRFQNLSLEPGM
jgi:replicative DNA helicase